MPRKCGVSVLPDFKMTNQRDIEWKTPKLDRAYYFSLVHNGSSLLKLCYGWMDTCMDEWIGGKPGGQMDDLISSTQFILLN